MFGGAYAIRPYPGRAFGSLRVPGKIRRRPQTPAPTRVRAFGSLRVSGRLPCPGRGRPQTPRGLGNLETTCLSLSEASETLKQLVWAFPTRRKRSAARFDTFRGLGASGTGVLSTRPASLPRQGPSADARAFLRSDRNKCTSSSCFCLRILIRLRGQRSIRKTCVSIRNITYFIPPCTWPECSFCRRPICCLSAPYASRGVPEIREPQTILYVAINTSEVGFFWGGGGKTKAGYTLRKSSTCTRLFAFRVQCLAS